MSLIVDGTTGVTFNDSSLQGAAASPYVLKNRIINGDMRIDQRNAGASVTITDTSNLTYTLDRWAVFGSAASKFSVQQNAGSVTPPVGFTNYLGVTSLAATSVASGEQYTISQAIEGFNCADFNWGSANAATVTLSFWVRSSLTGTFGGAIVNSALARGYGYTYTISSANTWEQKIITIAGDTTGTWLTNNGIGLRIYWGLGVGSDFSAPVGSWSAGSYRSATGATSVVGTNGATFYITGVQLEIGTSATPFERRLYGQELINCQRYCVAYTSNAGNALGPWGSLYATTAGRIFYKNQVTMRAAPTVSGTSGTGTAFVAAVNASANCSFANFVYSPDFNSWDLTSISSAGTIGQPIIYSGPFVLSAEL